MISIEQIREMLPEFVFLVKERIFPKGAEAKWKAMELGYLVEEKTDISEEKPSKMRGNVQETLKNERKQDFPSLMIKNVYELITINPRVKYSQMEDNLGVDESSVWWAVAWLKENGYISKVHSKVKGKWQLL